MKRPPKSSELRPAYDSGAYMAQLYGRGIANPYERTLPAYAAAWQSGFDSALSKARGE